jgi:hypothetical protein
LGKQNLESRKGLSLYERNGYSFAEFLAHRDAQEKRRSSDEDVGEDVEVTPGKVLVAHRSRQ